jgi:hypothetical protein
LILTREFVWVLSHMCAKAGLVLGSIGMLASCPVMRRLAAPYKRAAGLSNIRSFVCVCVLTCFDIFIHFFN